MGRRVPGGVPRPRQRGLRRGLQESPPLVNGDNNSPDFIELLRGLKELICMKNLEQWLAYN